MNLTELQTQNLKDIKAECNAFYEHTKGRLDTLTNAMDNRDVSNFRAASRLSRITDKLTVFINELNEF